MYCMNSIEASKWVLVKLAFCGLSAMTLYTFSRSLWAWTTIFIWMFFALVFVRYDAVSDSV